MNIYGTLAASHPSLARGQVWCRSCGHTQKVNTPGALAHGWPRCCGATMTIDSPEEQKRLAEARSPLCASPRQPRGRPQDEPMFPLSPPAKGGGDQGDSSSVARVDMTPPSGASDRPCKSEGGSS